MFKNLAPNIVSFCRRRPWSVAMFYLLATIGPGIFAGKTIGMDTDTSKLISPDLEWRQQELVLDEAFPQFVRRLVIVIDGVTPDRATDAANELAAALHQRPLVFRSVRQPGGGDFFHRNGLLFLPVDELQDQVNAMIQAQPLVAQLATDPSLRGLFNLISQALEGVQRGDVEPERFHAPFANIAATIESVLAGRPQPLSWQSLLTGDTDMEEATHRRFIEVQPRLDYRSLEAGSAATDEVRQIAEDLGLTPENGVRVRLTGQVAISDEEFSTVAEGAWISGITSFVLVVLLLYLGVRSVRLILAILITLIAGLVATTAFAAGAVGTLNPISVAFGVMFVGIAVDFGIQFSMCYRAERHKDDVPGAAMRRTAQRIVPSLALAAAATTIGFLSFVPTAYVGVSQLGLIAGFGMVIALLYNLTLLPALLTLLGARGAATTSVGFSRAAGIDRFLVYKRFWVRLGAGLIALAALILAPGLRFDFNPLNLRDPDTESVATALEIMADVRHTPYTVEILAESPESALQLGRELSELPEVSHALTVNTFVPKNQEDKLPLIEEAAFLLWSSLYANEPVDLADAADIRTSLTRAMEQLRAVDDTPGSPERRLADDLEEGLRRDLGILAPLTDALVSGLPGRLEALRLALDPEPVTLASLPDEIRRDWVAADGSARIAVYPEGNPNDNRVLRAFANVVRANAPNSTGTAITIQESGRTIVNAFLQAGISALVAITLLLAVVLRRAHDVLLVLAPLLLAGLMTIATCVLIGLPINFANIIALPLLLGIGVAYNIYFVMNWRAGVSGPLQSSTARAVTFSALTTAAAFGSLALSPHPGTADMGVLLTIALGCTLFATLIVLPALLGPTRTPVAEQPVAAQAE